MEFRPPEKVLSSGITKGVWKPADRSAVSDLGGRLAGVIGAHAKPEGWFGLERAQPFVRDVKLTDSPFRNRAMGQFFGRETGWIGGRPLVKFQGLCDLIGQVQNGIDPAEPPIKAEDGLRDESRRARGEFSAAGQFVTKNGIRGVAAIGLGNDRRSQVKKISAHASHSGGVFDL